MIHHEIIKQSYTIRRVQSHVRSARRGTPHWHQRMEIVRIVSGDMAFTIGNGKCLCKAGDVLMVKSGDIHSYDASQTGYTLDICTFDPALVYGLKEDIAMNSHSYSAEHLEAAGIAEEINCIFDALLQEASRADAWSSALSKANILRLCILLSRHAPAEYASNTVGVTKLMQFQSILAYIADHYQEDITLLYVANALGYTQSYLSTLFVTVTGMNYKRYLDTYRISRAIDMLQQTDDPISQISAKCGFSNIRTFNNTFGRITGTSPSKLRSQK